MKCLGNLMSSFPLRVKTYPQLLPRTAKKVPAAWALMARRLLGLIGLGWFFLIPYFASPSGLDGPSNNIFEFLLLSLLLLTQPPHIPLLLVPIYLIASRAHRPWVGALFLILSILPILMVITAPKTGWVQWITAFTGPLAAVFGGIILIIKPTKQLEDAKIS